MRKQALAALVLAALLLSGCGVKGVDTALSDGLSEIENRAEAGESVPPSSGTEKTDATAEPAQSPSEDERAEKPAPKILISSAYDSRFDYDLSVSFGYGRAPLFYCGDRLGVEDYEAVRDDPNYPRLAAALRAYDEESKAALQESVDNIESAARNDYGYGNYPGAEDYSMVYRTEGMAWLARADSRLVSFWTENYWSAGGAHPYTGFAGLNFDSETGEQLSITDVLTKDGAQRFPELFEQTLYEQYPYYSEGLIVESVTDTIREEMPKTLQFTVDCTGVTVLISPYELAAYAAGPAFVRMDFADYPDLFEEYYAAPSESRITALRPQNENNWYSELNTYRLHTAAGERTLNVQFVPDDYESGRMSSLTVTLDGASWEAEDFYGFGVSPYLVHVDGKDFLYLEYEMPNDWDALYVLDLNGDAPRLLDSRSEGFGMQMPTETESVLLSTRSYCMSTYGIARHYRISAAGTPEALDELYYATYAPTLTLRRSLTLTQLLPDGSEQEATLAQGSTLHFYRTNNDDLVDLKDSDGKLYRVSYDHGEDYIGTVNGIPLMEAFDGVVFAG